MPLLRLDTSLEVLLERLETLSQPAVLATVVATAGSTYRKAGARMLIEADGRLTGLLSGGCLEQDLREYARGVLATGMARIVDYDLRGADDLVYGLGAGCEGAMRILLEALAPGGALAQELAEAGARLATGRPVALAMTHRGDVAALGTRAGSGGAPPEPALAAGIAAVLEMTRSQSLPAGADLEQSQCWIQYLAPAPRVLVCGAGPDAEPLVALLRLLRFAVTVTDHRPAYADPARFKGARMTHGPAAELAMRVPLAECYAAVVMSHHLDTDSRYLEELSKSPIAHIGLLGPRPRRERLLADLGPGAERLRPRLRAPAGLDIGAVTPEAIALAIAAELHALAAGRTPVPAGAAP